MKLSVLMTLSSAIIVSSLAAPPNGYYNRRQYQPKKYFYGHKSGYNSGPPINKYRPPGYRSTRNPIIGSPYRGSPYQTGPQGINYPPLPQGVSHIPQGIPQTSFPQGIPQGFSQAHVQQGVSQSAFPQNVLQSAVPQGFQQGPPQNIHSYQPVVQQLPQGFQSLPPKRYNTPAASLPQLFTKSPSLQPHSTAAHWKTQPSALLHNIKEEYGQAQSLGAPITRTFYKPDDERSPIHTIPAPKLGPQDKPPNFEYRLQQSTPSQYQITPGFKLLDKSVANQLNINPQAFLLQQQTKSLYAPDPDPKAPQVRVPPTNDPFSQPSNDKVPIDIYLQQQLDNEIAQQESLLLQKQKALEAQQYQQQLEAQLLLQAQQQALQAEQEQINQQILQQQTLEAQRQLAIQAQQQQAALQQPQYQSAAQQTSETLTADELFNLMHGITPNNQPRNQPSAQPVQDALLVQQQNTGAVNSNFQPNYQSFNYDERAHQAQNQQEQQQQHEQQQIASLQAQKYTESFQQQNVHPQYQNFNYDEKTKRNGFTSEGNSEVGHQILNQIDELTQNASKNEIRETKKDKRYQKHAFPTTQGYTSGYSTLPKEITESQYVQQQASLSTPSINTKERPIIKKVKPNYQEQIENKKAHPNNLKKKNKIPLNNPITNNGYSTIAEDLLQQHDLKNDLQQLTYSTLPNQKILEVLKHHRQENSTQYQQPHIVTPVKDDLQRIRENAQKFYNPHILQAVRNATSSDNVQIQQSIQIYENNYPSNSNDNHIDLSGMTTTGVPEPLSTTSTTTVSTTSEANIVTEINIIESTGDSDNQESSVIEEIMLQDESKPLEDTYHSNSHSYFGQRIRPKRT